MDTNYDNGFRVGNNVYGEIEEIIDQVERRYNLLRNFEIINSPPLDHHYSQQYEYKVFQRLPAPLVQKIEQEWALLETNLPNTIWVRGYRTRIDLMRAAVIGPPDTPYYQALFFFDVLFPPNYPASPPKLYYHSYGLHPINPSLHPRGKVYLPLLECWFKRLICSWFGCKKEGKWKPEQSTILEVLISIQESILSPEAYRCVTHKEEDFLLTCEGMIRMLQAPLMDFEDFVAGHFRTKAHEILYNYQADKRSAEFLKLLKAFEVNGTYCRHHLSQDRRVETTQPMRKTSRKGCGLLPSGAKLKLCATISF